MNLLKIYVILQDTLRRANFDVTVASVHKEKRVVCSRKVIIEADELIEDVKDNQYDLLCLPGGLKGAENFLQSDILQDMVNAQRKRGSRIAAICASPAIAINSIFVDQRATCYPKFKDKLNKFVDEPVVLSEDSNLISSQGPGTTLVFVLKIVELFYGVNKSDELYKEMIVSKI
eukprot:TRINITY_DN161_c0_g1_i2.p1 TRINITY_DN161_c0_g1~~TRINITY_DN161_c0_g1_i2.p1  ORF type:complete len:174 (-),score=29.89 TRINITY_DN161_c0_g1_i2:33-554(-)